MDRWKSRGGKSQRGEGKKWEDQGREREKKEDAAARKGRKVAMHCVFPMICGSGGSKSRLAKAAGAEPAGQMRDKKLHAVVARSTFGSKKVNTPHVRTTFGSWDVEKVHAVVARSTFPSQNAQSTPASYLLEVEMSKKYTPLWCEAYFQALDHFWELRCRKSARRCGAKHISKSKRTKQTNVGPLFRVQMSKKCTPLWREAYFQALDHFWELRCRKSARRCGAKHISKSKCTKQTNVRPLFRVQMSKKCTPLWRSKVSRTDRFGPLFDVQPSFFVAGARDCAKRAKTWRFCSGFNYNSIYNTLHSTALHNITSLHSTPLHYAPLHYTTLHPTTLHYTTLHPTTLHYSTLHHTTLH